ncbi:unnamed protein product, partial [Sphacelaria rigidula]
GCGPSECRGGGSSGMAWRYGTRVGLSGARLKKLETAMEAAMEHLPVTYEEHARQERLAHFRMMYMVEKEMAELPIEFLRGIGCEGSGINVRLTRMCSLLTKSHRTIKRLALSRWGMALERLLADKFAEDMLRYEHSRLAGTLSAAKQRWEEKIVRRRFSLWRRSVRLARTAERESLASDAADTIQRWARRRLAVHRRDRMRRRREQRLKEEAREKSQAVLGVFAFEDDRRSSVWRTLRLLETKRGYDNIHRRATKLQLTWRRYRVRQEYVT